MNLVKGEAEVFPKEGKSFDPARIPQAIEDAGFTASEVLVTVEGILVDRGHFLELQVPGLTQALRLGGGAQWETLRDRGDLIEKRIELSGAFHPARDGRPPSVSVEEFSAQSSGRADVPPQ